MSEAEGAIAPAAPAAAPEAASVEVRQAAPAEGAQGAQNAADEAPAGKPAEKSEETPEQAEKRREGRRYGRRLDAAYRRAAEAQARAELLEKQLAEVRQPKETADPGAPKLTDFSDIEEYAAAKADYAKAQALKEHTAKQQAEAQKRQVEELTTAWEEKASRADGKYDDFDEMVGDIRPTTPLLAAIMEAENGEDVAYHLAKNPAEFKRIAALSVTGQIREIGKLEAKLLAEPPKPKTPSRAPAPISPLGGKSGASSDVPSDTDDIATWIRKENARMNKRAAGA